MINKKLRLYDRACNNISLFIKGEKLSYLTTLAYQARHWKLKDTGSLSGSDLSVVVSKIPSISVCRKLAKTVNTRLAMNAKEVVHIMDGQSVGKAVQSFRRHVPGMFPGKAMST